MPERSFQIGAVRSAADLEAVAQLFNAYASSIGIDLGYQDFDKELATLPANTRRPMASCCLRAIAMERRWDASA